MLGHTQMLSLWMWETVTKIETSWIVPRSSCSGGSVYLHFLEGVLLVLGRTQMNSLQMWQTATTIEMGCIVRRFFLLRKGQSIFTSLNTSSGLSGYPRLINSAGGYCFPSSTSAKSMVNTQRGYEA